MRGKMRRWLFLLIAALLLVSAGLSGCGTPPVIDEDFEDDGEPYVIKFYMPNNGMTGANKIADLAKVAAEASKITKREINATLQIVSFNYSEYSTKMSGVIGAAVEYDVCHTSPLVNHYALNVQREMFYPLDKLLDKYAPYTKSLFSEEIWNQVRINGKIYGAMNNQLLARAPGMIVMDRDLFIDEFLPAKHPDKNVETVYEVAPDSLQIMEEYMEWLKQNNKGNGGKIQFSNVGYLYQTLYKLDDLTSNIMTPGVIRVSDAEKNDFTVVNQFEIPEFTELYNTAKRYIEKGYVPRNYSGKYDLFPDSTYKPGRAQISEGVMRDSIKLGGFNYYTSSASLTMNAVSVTSRNPARAMKFIELLNTNRELHNILQYGIKDLHYTIPDPENEPNRVKPVENSRYDNINFGWGLGDEFNSFVRENQPYDMFEQYAEINETAKPSPLMGFTFDATSVKQKVADCQSLYQQYVEGIFQGKYPSPDAALANYLRDLEDAGAKEIIAEKQRQIDAWLASKS